jgi:PIN domain nuclease of toxin-antitoxin system
VIVLDTHAWLWWLSDPDQLGRAAMKRIRGSERIGIAAVSCFEIAAAVAKNRITLDRGTLEWLQQAVSAPRLELLPLTPAVTVKATMLGPFHGDPADCLIVATAILESAVLVTKDRRIRKYGAVSTIW